MKTHLNLLPWKCRQSQLVRRRLLQWGMTWAAAAALVVTGYGLRAVQRRAAQETVAQLERQAAPIEAMRNESAALRQKLDHCRRREAIVDRLSDPRPPLALLGMVSRSARECGGALRVEQLAARSGEPVAKAPESAPVKSEKPPAKSTRSSSSVATLKGTAQDNLAVARFVLALRQTQAFDRVELKSSAGQNASGKGCSYLVECGY